MSDNPLSDYLAGLDEDNFRQPVLNGIQRMLSEAGEGAPDLANELGERILRLKTGPGKQLAFSLLYEFVPTSTAIRDLAIELTHDDAWEARLAGVQALALVPSDPDARQRLNDLLTDPHPTVKMFCVEQFPVLRQHPLVPNTGALRILPDDQHRDEALNLLAELEQAIYFLEESELDEAQRRILDEEMLPTISDLRDIFTGTAPDKANVNMRRHDAIMNIGRLKGAANAVALASNPTTPVSDADEATKSLKRSVSGLTPIASYLLNMAERSS